MRRVVDGIVEARHLVADVELAARRRPVRLPDPDDAREDRLAVARQRRPEPRPVHVERRVDGVEVREEARRNPAGRVVRKDRQAHAIPPLPRAEILLLEYEHDVLGAVGRGGVERRHSTCRGSRLGTDNGRSPHGRPVRDLVVGQPDRPRVPGRRRRQRRGAGFGSRQQLQKSSCSHSGREDRAGGLHEVGMLTKEGVHGRLTALRVLFLTVPSRCRRDLYVSTPANGR
jgi:hypothetical protein